MDEITDRTHITAEQWGRIQALFSAAVDLPAWERDRYLEEQCGNETALRKRVASLIASVTESDSWLAGRIANAADSFRVVAEPVAGDRAGAWQLVRPLGQGGMGAVWLAERADAEFTKQAAIKFVRAGLSAPELLERFRVERQILASLEHPNIARLLDAGRTEQGLPFLVMEYIEGEPIGAFCESRKLDVRERMRLFQKVCDAVQTAHRRLIVHRDLKPANILVTKDGVPKLLDFGIAKLLDQGTDLGLTSQTQRVMTPDFASPEQVRGAAVTVATDVWGLGAVLFTLLTGRPPFSGSGLHELEVAICEREAPAVSTTAQASVDSDIDAIVAKALRKEPEQRYESASAMAADIENYLNGYPVAARRGSRRYRLMKFARRNRVLLGAAAVVVIAVTSGLFLTLQAQRKAERRFAQVRELTGRFLFEIHNSIKETPGTTKAQTLIVKRGLEYLDGLAAEAQGDLALQDELATAYESIRDIQQSLVNTSLQDTAGAIQSANKALLIREQMVQSEPANAAWRLGLAVSQNRTAQMLGEHGKVAQAEELYRKALQHTMLLEKQNRSKEVVESLIGSYQGIGQMARHRGGGPESEAALEKAVELNRERIQRFERTANTLFGLCSALVALSDGIRQRREDDPRALAAYEEADRVIAEAEEILPNNVQVLRQVALVKSRLGIFYKDAGNPAKALEFFQESLRRNERLAAKDPANGLIARSVAVQRVNASEPLLLMGRYKEALEIIGPAVAYRAARAQKDKASFEAQEDLANALYLQGRAMAGVDRTRAAEIFTRAIRLREPLAAEHPERAELQLRMGRLYIAFGELREAQRQIAEALELYKQADAVFRRMLERKQLSRNGQSFWNTAQAGLRRLEGQK